jgi:hypothetical protein
MTVSIAGEWGFDLTCIPPRCDLSPDGRCLLWLSGHRTWIAAMLDGAREVRWRSQGRLPGHGFWLRDSRRWVELVSHYGKGGYTITRAVVHSVDDPLAAREIPTPGLEDGLVLGLTGEDRFLIRHGVAREDLAPVRFSEVALEGSTASLRPFDIHVPGGLSVSDVELSPGGDRLAWVLAKHGRSRELPGMYSLRVSSIHGEAVREIGRTRGLVETARGGRKRPFYYWPQAIRWVPGEERLSFVFRGELFTVPVQPR